MIVLSALELERSNPHKHGRYDGSLPVSLNTIKTPAWEYQVYAHWYASLPRLQYLSDVETLTQYASHTCTQLLYYRDFSQIGRRLTLKL